MLKKLFAVTAVFAAGAAGAFEMPPQIFKPGSVMLFQAEIAMRYLAYRPNDNLHPAAKGYRAWHDGILPTIQEIVGK